MGGSRRQANLRPSPFLPRRLVGESSSRGACRRGRVASACREKPPRPGRADTGARGLGPGGGDGFRSAEDASRDCALAAVGNEAPRVRRRAAPLVPERTRRAHSHDEKQNIEHDLHATRPKFREIQEGGTVGRADPQRKSYACAGAGSRARVSSGPAPPGSPVVVTLLSSFLRACLLRASKQDRRRRAASNHRRSPKTEQRACD